MEAMEGCLLEVAGRLNYYGQREMLKIIRSLELREKQKLFQRKKSKIRILEFILRNL